MSSSKKNLFRSLFSKHGAVDIQGKVPTWLKNFNNLTNFKNKSLMEKAILALLAYQIGKLGFKGGKKIYSMVSGEDADKAIDRLGPDIRGLLKLQPKSTSESGQKPPLTELKEFWQSLTPLQRIRQLLKLSPKQPNVDGTKAPLTELKEFWQSLTPLQQLLIGGVGGAALTGATAATIKGLKNRASKSDEDNDKEAAAIGPIPKLPKLSLDSLKSTFGDMVSAIRAQPLPIKALLSLAAVGTPILAYKGLKHLTGQSEEAAADVGGRVGSWWDNLTPQQKLLAAVGAVGIPSAAFLGARALSGNKKKNRSDRGSSEEDSYKKAAATAPIPKPPTLSLDVLKKTFGDMVSAIRSQPLPIKALLALSAVGTPMLAYKGLKHLTGQSDAGADIGSRIKSLWGNLTPQQKLLAAVGGVGIPSAAFLGARALSGNKKKKNRSRWLEE